MTLTNVNPGDIFSVRVIKRFNDQRWANTYELRFNGNVSMANPIATFNDALVAIAAAEVDILLSRFTVERAVLSTFAPDSRPYNPETFISRAVEIQGSRAVPYPQNPLPLTTCMLVKKVVPTGRLGNILYRGVLHTGNGNMAIEGFSIDNATTSLIENRLNNLRQQLETQFGLELCLAAIDKQTNNRVVRKVTALEARAKATIKLLNNKYFDKGGANGNNGSNASNGN